MAQKYVFISYSSQNTSDAENVKRVLEANHISCWMAKYDIPGGRDFGTEIIRAIDGCSAFLLLVTREAQASPWVPKELNYAIGRKKFILPLLMDGVYPTAFQLQINTVQCITAYGRRNEAYKEMIARIRGEWSGQPVLIPPKPPVVIEKKKREEEKKNYAEPVEDDPPPMPISRNTKAITASTAATAATSGSSSQDSGSSSQGSSQAQVSGLF